MKKTLLFTLAFLIFQTFAFAQNSVKLNINHELENNVYLANTAAKNNMGHDFKLKRVEYYLSQISIVHDGGVETPMTGVYVLVDASEATNIDLGSYNINTVEAVKFYVGVDSATNHSDPATYPSTHALSPKLPSMHWGWASGYRFVALEGQGSANYNQSIELHALGDDNYFQTTVNVSAAAANNEVIIDIYADYARALENISVNGGTFVHGFGGDALQMLTNFRDYVFNSNPTSTIDFSEVNSFKAFPNPTSGAVTIELKTSQDFNYQVIVTDILGKQVDFINEVKGNTSTPLNLKESGLYFVQLVKNGKTILTEKVMVL